MPKKLTEEEVRNGLYLVSPAGINELRGYFSLKWPGFDESSLVAAMNHLIDRGVVQTIMVDGIQLWCLRGQRVG